MSVYITIIKTHAKQSSPHGHSSIFKWDLYYLRLNKLRHSTIVELSSYSAITYDV